MKAVKKLEFGRVNPRTNLYIQQELDSPSKREDSALHRIDALSKMSLRRNVSDFSQAVGMSTLGGK